MKPTDVPRIFSHTVAACASSLVLLSHAVVCHGEQADRNKPINIEAEIATADQTSRVRTLEGNVILTQGTMRLSAEKMVVKEDESGFVTAHVFGGASTQVAFRQKRQDADDYMEGYADRAEFDDRADTLKLFSRARLKNGADELKGEYIYYNSATEVMQARNAAPGDKPPSASAATPGRVTITIQPKIQDDKTPPGKSK